MLTVGVAVLAGGLTPRGPAVVAEGPALADPEEPPPAARPAGSPLPVDRDKRPGGAIRVEAPTSYQNGAIVTISGEISDVTTESVKRRVEEARKAGAAIIIFEMDTPGGMVSSALEICDYIKNLTEIKTVAWVNTEAYSAGSMISVACDEIVMAAASTIGDCGVILGGPTGPQEVPEELRAKAESPVLEQFRDSAARNGYNALLCEAMVVKERVVYWVEHTETGERRFVNQETKDRLTGGTDSDSPFATPAPRPEDEGPVEWRLVESYQDPVTGKTVPIIQPVVAGTELLTMSQSRAMAFGFCKAIVTSLEDLRNHHNVVGDVQRFDFTWSERFTRWMTSMPVRMFLLLIIFLGVYVEFNTPGVGVPGLVALICLAIFVGAPYITGLANVWEIVLILLGFALLAVEIFVVPGFGIPGIAGILCILVGLLATFIPESPGQPFPISWPRDDFAVRGLKIGVITLASSSAASVVAMIIFSRLLPRISWLHSVMPENPTLAGVSVKDPYHGYAQVGDVGRIEGPLRPAGKAWFGDLLVDVVSEGEFVEPPAEVEVVERRGNRVVVRPVRREEQR
jgi:membrane-bound serine protease (ClpP class)